MPQALSHLLGFLTPVMVAIITAYSAVLVAKVNKVQKDITTNHGSKNIGDAIDKLSTQVDRIDKNQDMLLTSVSAIQRKGKVLSTRVDTLTEATNQENYTTARRKAITDETTNTTIN